MRMLARTEIKLTELVVKQNELAKAQKELAEAQKQTDRNLKALINSLRKGVERPLALHRLNF